MGSTAEFNQKDMSFNPIVRLLLQRVRDDEEGPPDAPWKDTPFVDSPALAFPAGLIWYSPFARTIRFTWEAYEGDPTPGPATWQVARHLVIPVFGTPPITFAHDLRTFPNCQFIDNSTRELFVPDSVVWTDVNTITLDHSTDVDLFALVTG